MSAQQVTLLASVQQFLDRQHGLYIDGAQQAAQSEKRLTVWNPATGQAIASTADASAGDVDRAVMSAWRAFVSRSWAGRTPADRERVLLRFADLVEQHGEDQASIHGVAAEYGNAQVMQANAPALEQDLAGAHHQVGRYQHAHPQQGDFS